MSFYITVSYSFVYRPKDLYQDRPLPHLIGSKEWHDKWHVGLIDSDAEDVSDNEGANDLTKSSTSSSSSLGSLPSHAPTTKSGSENSYWNVQAVTDKLNKQKSDLFENSSDEERSASKKVVPSHKKSESEEEKVSKSNEHESKSIPEIDEPIEPLPREQQPQHPPVASIFRPQRQEHQPVIANLFDSEPPELFDEDSNKKSIRKPVNLFLESDDEDDNDYDDLFGSKTQAPSSDKTSSLQTSSGAVPTSKHVNLFDDNSSGDDFSNIIGSTSDKKKEVKNAELIDKHNDSKVEKLETKPKIPSITNHSQSIDPKLLRNLFDDEPPDDDYEIFKKKDGATSENTKQETNAVKVTSKSVNLFDDDDDESVFDEIVNKKSNPPLPAEPKNAHKQDEEAPIKRISKTVNLFDDSDGDDNFDFLIKKTPTAQKPSNNQETKQEKIAEAPKEIPKKDAKISKPEKEPVPTKSTFLETKTNKNSDKSALDYISSRLFDDIPPDDDQNEADNSPSKLSADSNQAQNVGSPINKPTKIFYDDISETIVEQNNVTEKDIEKTSSQWSASSYLFNDEPPPDDQVDEPTADRHSFDAKKGNKTDFSKKLNLFAGNQQSESIANVEKQPIRQPKKLDIKKFDINVAALLPGSKRTNTSSKPKEDVDDVDKSKEVEDDSLNLQKPDENIVSTIKNITAENVDSSGRLVSMNKNRARNTTTRRPSTRRGRQQQYQKSVESDVFGEVVTAPAGDNQIDKNKNMENVESKINKKFSKNSEQPFSKPDTKKEKKSTKNSDGLFSTTSEIKENFSKKLESVFPVTSEAIEKSSKISEDLFSVKTSNNFFSTKSVSENMFSTVSDIVEKPLNASDDMFSVSIKNNNKESSSSRSDDLFATKTEIKQPKEKSDNKKTFLEKSSIFGDDEDIDEPLFKEKVPEIKSSPAPESKAIIKIRSETKAITENKTSLSFLEEDNAKDDDDDWLTNVINEKPPPLDESQRSSSGDKAQKSSWGLFGEDESENEDDDWLLPSTTETPKSGNVPKEEKSAVEKSSPTKNVTSLFGDDDDDDDLFGKPPPLPDDKPRSTSSVQAKTKEKASLFGDESSEDDDLFGGGVNKSKSIGEGKKEQLDSTSVIKSKALEKNSSGTSKLFSDSEDDDDDLFSPKTKGMRQYKSILSQLFLCFILLFQFPISRQSKRQHSKLRL